MAGQIKANQLQLGDSATATQNFVWQTNVDGTAKLARGNIGATSQDILTVGAGGVVKTPQNLVAFSVYLGTANQSLTTGVAAKVAFNAKEFDTTTAFDATTNYRFNPQVAGYYQVNASLRLTATSESDGFCSVYKNGSPYKDGSRALPVGSTYMDASLSCLVFLNGSTDYLELYTTAVGTSPVVTFGLTTTYFQAHLLGAT